MCADRFAAVCVSYAVEKKSRARLRKDSSACPFVRVRALAASARRDTHRHSHNFYIQQECSSRTCARLRPEQRHTHTHKHKNKHDVYSCCVQYYAQRKADAHGTPDKNDILSASVVKCIFCCALVCASRSVGRIVRICCWKSAQPQNCLVVVAEESARKGNKSVSVMPVYVYSKVLTA